MHQSPRIAQEKSVGNKGDAFLPCGSSPRAHVRKLQIHTSAGIPRPSKCVFATIGVEPALDESGQKKRAETVDSGGSLGHCKRFFPFMRHTISILVENKFGVLTRVAGMFSGRGFNIDTLNVGPTLDPSAPRMTIVVRGDDKVLEQVTKQLEKLIDVIDVQDFRDEEYVDRELVLLRVNANSKNRAEVMQICDIFRAKIIDVQPSKLAIEITGTEGKISKFLTLMDTFGISDLTRTGKVALSRMK